MNGDTPPAPAAPWRVLVRGVLWLLTAEFVALAVLFLIGFVTAVAGNPVHVAAGPDAAPEAVAYSLASTVALQATLLFADVRQGRLAGDGSLAVGLGAGPVRRPMLIALLAVLMVGWVLAYIAVLIRFESIASFIAHDVHPAPALQMTGGPALLVIRLLLIVGLAPMAEELFFRGWLWTALRRSWSVWATALCTGGIWVALHALEGAVRVPILVPAAILLSLARHYGGSVRASIPVHMLNNLTAMGIQLVALATH